MTPSMRQGITLVTLIILTAAAIWYSLTPIDPRTGAVDRNGELVALGLDLKGGMRVTMEPADPGAVDQGTMALVRDVLQNRVDSFGLAGTEVRLKGNNQVLVVLPGARNPQQAIEVISKTAQLEFRYLDSVRSEKNLSGRYRMDVQRGDPAKQEPDRYTFTDAETNQPVPTAEIVKGSELILRGNSLRPTSRATIDPNSGRPMVTFELDSQGARVFGDFTTDHVGEVLAVVLDNEIISAPTINEPITGGEGVITGSATMDEARVLSNLLNSGALPITLRIAETQTVGATLGQESVERSITAGLWGLGLVGLFMLLYYWLPGLIACVALLVYAAITFAIFKGVGIFPPVVLDLPGITGFILSVGMAVDGNVLIFERIKEEIKAGKSLHAAIDAGFTRAFAAILDSNVTVWIVAAILIWLGAPMIKGFAITLAIGTAVSMFSAITVTRTLLHVLTTIPALRNPALFALNMSWLALVFPAFREGGVLRVFDKRRFYLGLSALAVIVSLVLIGLTPFGMGLRPGVDFTGGSVVEAAFKDPNVTREQVAGVLEAQGIPDATIRMGQADQSLTRVTLTATDVDPATAGTIRERLESLAGFDASAYKSSTADKTFTAEGVYTSPVTEQQVRNALTAPVREGDRALTLADLKVTVAPEAGGGAIRTTEIITRPVENEKLNAILEALNGIGGGTIGPLSRTTFVGPSIAREVTLNGISSVVVASLAIILFLAFRFAIGGFVNGLKFGVGAVIALFHDIILTVGLFALMGWLADWRMDTLFLTACLGLLGFSVNDTIVVYDRIRENLRYRLKGETFADVADRSMTQSFDRSFNTSFAVIVALAAMAIFGGESLRQFNIALLFGMAVGTYSSIFVATPLVVILERAIAGRNEAAAGGPPRQPARPAGGSPPTPARRPRPAPPTPAPRPSATATAEPDTAAEDASGEADATATPRPGTVRPRKKRRM